jgi:hypothetical protein
MSKEHSQTKSELTDQKALACYDQLLKIAFLSSERVRQIVNEGALQETLDKLNQEAASLQQASQEAKAHSINGIAQNLSSQTQVNQQLANLLQATPEIKDPLDKTWIQAATAAILTSLVEDDPYWSHSKYRSDWIAFRDRVVAQSETEYAETKLKKFQPQHFNDERLGGMISGLETDFKAWKAFVHALTE